MKVSRSQRREIRRHGKVFLEMRTRPGWSGDLPFYIVRCQDHGFYVDYAHGHDEYFSCPECRREKYGDDDD